MNWSSRLGRYLDLVLTTVIVVLVCLAAAFYIHRYQKRLVKNHARASALVGLFILLLAATKIAALLFNHTYGATATAVTAAIILTITYEQRFAIGMSIFYCVLACLAAGPITSYQSYQPIDEYQLTEYKFVFDDVCRCYALLFLPERNPNKDEAARGQRSGSGSSIYNSDGSGFSGFWRARSSRRKVAGRGMSSAMPVITRASRSWQGCLCRVCFRLSKKFSE